MFAIFTLPLFCFYVLSYIYILSQIYISTWSSFLTQVFFKFMLSGSIRYQVKLKNRTHGVYFERDGIHFFNSVLCFGFWTKFKVLKLISLMNSCLIVTQFSFLGDTRLSIRRIKDTNWIMNVLVYLIYL